MKIVVLFILSSLSVLFLWGLMLLDTALNGTADGEVWDGAFYVTQVAGLYSAVVFIVSWGFYRLISVPYSLAIVMALLGGAYPIWHFWG